MDDKLYIKDHINDFAFTNARFLRGAPKGVLLRLRGLCLDIPLMELTREGRKYAKEGILLVYPYTAPWSWMNPETVRMIDQILDGVCENLRLDTNIPLVVYGHSLGGYGALTYGVFGTHKPCASVAVSPICDLNYHATEHHGILVSMYHAFCHMEEKLGDTLYIRSPVNIISTMLRIPYYIAYCSRDKQVDSVRHAIPLVTAMRQYEHDVRAVAENGEHCELSQETEQEIFAFICDNIRKESV